VRVLPETAPLRGARVAQRVLEEGGEEGVGAVREQQRHHFLAAGGDGNLQRRLGAPVFGEAGAALDVGAALQQQTRHPRVTLQRRVRQRRPVLRLVGGAALPRAGTLRVHVGARLQQQPHRRLVAVHARRHQRRQPLLVHRVDLQQNTHKIYLFTFFITTKKKKVPLFRE